MGKEEHTISMLIVQVSFHEFSYDGVVAARISVIDVYVGTPAPPPGGATEIDRQQPVGRWQTQICSVPSQFTTRGSATLVVVIVMDFVALNSQ